GIAEIFAPIVKRPRRPAWSGSARRTPTPRAPVLSPKELALTKRANGATPAIAAAKSTVAAPAPAQERSPDEAAGRGPPPGEAACARPGPGMDAAPPRLWPGGRGVLRTRS